MSRSLSSEDHYGITTHSSLRREILKSIRHIENRLCADCSRVIGNLEVIYASMTYGVWICEMCASIHRDWDISKIKASTDEWSEVDIQNLSSHTNEGVNATLERYIPYGLLKCTEHSSKSEKEWWIQAKYNSKLFMLPGGSDGPTIAGSSSSLGLTNILPTRLVDFFLTISVGRCEEYGMNLSGFKLDGLHFSPEITGCVPDKKQYSDTEIPSRLGDFVFPSGIGLTTEETTPLFFTFVLTDVSAVKLYGAVLQISEIFEPEDYPSVLGHSAGSGDLPDLGLVYVPKALVLLSHYPFFYLFQCILEQLYRLSLSSCPLPMDRYVVNMLEVPLPPRGCVDVSYCSLADCTLTISRPPSNQLPMIDFSFRPLFGSLSVDNILLVFSFLMNEHKVCFASGNISLLTPVQETFLALLFPLVWQGAYIPILPSHMLDILEAPVPLIVGIDKREFHNFGNILPEGCVTVDLDTNTVHVGIDYSTDLPLLPLELPSRELIKLKAKLVEVGECIRRNPEDVNGSRLKESLRQAGLLFPNKEHLVPMDKFSTEEGVMLSRRDHEEQNYYLSDTDSKVQVPYQCTISSRRSTNILCPANNANTGDGFDAKEIRYAFLRLFISIFRDFQQFIEEENDSTSASSSTGTKKKKNSFGSTIGRFSRDSYLNVHTGVFFTHLVQTQMFSKFAEEREAAPDQPEIKFFQESIIDKLNRSKLKSSKTYTPFLDSKHEMIVSTYIPNLPSKVGIKPGEKFHYLHFPTMHGGTGREKGLVPVIKPLQRNTEHRRLVNASAQAAVLNQSGRRRRNSRVSSGAQQEDVNMLYDAKQRYIKISKAMTTVKSLYRMQPYRRRFKLMRSSCIKIQKVFRWMLLLRLSRTYNQQQQIKLRRIQNIVRGFMMRLKFIKMKRSAIIIQAAIRRHSCTVAYKSMKRRVVALQSIRRGWLARCWYNRTVYWAEWIQKMARGFLARKAVCSMRARIIETLRQVIFLLFKLNNTSLRERSIFWLSCQGNRFMSLAIHREQVFVLWRALKLHAAEAERLEGSMASMDQKVGLVLQYLQGRVRASDFHESTALTDERTQLYTILKSGGAQNETLFNIFGINNEKKRKRHLTSSLLWSNYETSGVSAKAVLEIVNVDIPSLDICSTDVGRAMIVKRLRDVTRSCLQVIASVEK